MMNTRPDEITRGQSLENSRRAPHDWDAPVREPTLERDFFIDNLLVRVHLIIEMI